MEKIIKKSAQGLILLGLVFTLSTTKVYAQEKKEVTEKQIRKTETQVTNIKEVSKYINFNKKTPIKVKNKSVGYAISSAISKGHRRSGGCCQFNGGWCGKFSSVEISVDLNENITKSSIKMYLGIKNGAEYLRFEGLSDEDLMDEPIKG